MDKSTNSQSNKKVSKEMSEVLNRLSGEIPKDRVKEVRALLVDRRLADNNVRCTCGTAAITVKMSMATGN